MTATRLPSGALVEPVELTPEEVAEFDRLVVEAGGRAPLEYAYTPHPRQEIAHGTFADELLYGGAAGGGKSRFARAEALAFALEVPGSAGIIFRRTFPDLNRAGGVIPSMLEEVPVGLGNYNREKAILGVRAPAVEP